MVFNNDDDAANDREHDIQIVYSAAGPATSRSGMLLPPPGAPMRGGTSRGARTRLTQPTVSVDLISRPSRLIIASSQIELEQSSQDHPYGKEWIDEMDFFQALRNSTNRSD